MDEPKYKPGDLVILRKEAWRIYPKALHNNNTLVIKKLSIGYQDTAIYYNMTTYRGYRFREDYLRRVCKLNRRRTDD